MKAKTRRTRPGSQRRIADFLEDVSWMAATGESLSGAARRLDTQPASLERRLTRSGAHDLAAALRANEPLLHR